MIVEFDGASHEGREGYDATRKAWLESQGYTVLRFGSDIVGWFDDESLFMIAEACRAGTGSDCSQ